MATASFVLEFLSFSPIVGREQPGIKIMMKTMWCLSHGNTERKYHALIILTITFRHHPTLDIYILGRISTSSRRVAFE
jgi:hypothetical protein